MQRCGACTFDNPPDTFLCGMCNAELRLCQETSTELSDGFVLFARRLWDGRSDFCVSDTTHGMCVAVECGRIALLGRADRLPYGTRHTIDLREQDSTIIPGLIDAHVHMEFDPKYSLHGQPQLGAEAAMDRLKARALSMVSHGITSARDLGGKGGAMLLRDAIDRGECVGPRLLCAGQPLTKPQGHCHQWGGEVRGEAQIRSVIERQVRSGADLIKIMATGGVRTPGTNPAESAFSQEELNAAAAAARMHGKRLAAHAHGVGGIATAAAAGVHTIEHCSWVDRHGAWGRYDESTIGEIAQRGIFVCPTVGAGWARQPALQSALSPALERMHLTGVRIVAGSDCGAIPNLAHHRLADGVVVLGRCAGMSHAEALRSATSEAAAALGLEAECGTLSEGHSADLLVVRGDPIGGSLERSLCAPPLAVVC